MPKYICNRFCCLRQGLFAAKYRFMTKASHNMASRSNAPLADGRRERSRSSRSKIVAAMLDLVGKGDVAPSAARVAEVAGVGLRSVFRHFDDMDELYREMGGVIEAQVMPIILQAPLAPVGRKSFSILLTGGRRSLKRSCPSGFRATSNDSSRLI